MRKRYEIETDGSKTELLILETLLDIRNLLEEKAPQTPKPKRGKTVKGDANGK